MTFDKIVPSSRTIDTAVSSQLVSIPNIIAASVLKRRKYLMNVKDVAAPRDDDLDVIRSAALRSML